MNNVLYYIFLLP